MNIFQFCFYRLSDRSDRSAVFSEDAYFYWISGTCQVVKLVSQYGVKFRFNLRNSLSDFAALLVHNFGCRAFTLIVRTQDDKYVASVRLSSKQPKFRAGSACPRHNLWSFSEDFFNSLANLIGLRQGSSGRH